MGTIHEFIAKTEITATVTPISKRSDDVSDSWGRDARHFNVLLRMPGGNAVNFEFSQGSAHTKPPTAADVLDCLASDAALTEEAFEDWAVELGYDPDSRKAERTYNACQAQTQKLRMLLRHSDALFNELVYETERL